MSTELELLEKEYTDLCIQYDKEWDSYYNLCKKGKKPDNNTVNQLSELKSNAGWKLNVYLLNSCGKIFEKARYKAHLKRRKELKKLKKENDDNEEQLVSTQRATHNLIEAELKHLSYLLIYYKM
jgi:hypothetical protein